MIWRKEESLLWWIVTQHKRKRRYAGMHDRPAVGTHPLSRLTSLAEIEAFAGSIERP